MRVRKIPSEHAAFRLEIEEFSAMTLASSFPDSMRFFVIDLFCD